MADRPHAPSQARAIAQEAKRGGDPLRLAGEARSIGDPSHAAWALAHVAVHPALSRERALDFLSESIALARRVPEPWRRAELTVDLAKILLGLENPAVAEPAERSLLDLVATLEPGAPLAAAVRGLAPRLARRRFADLWRHALRDTELLDDGKAILAAWADGGAPSEPQAEAVRAAIGAVADPAVRARLLGHLHLQASRSGLRLPFAPLSLAAEVARGLVADADRVELLRILALEATHVEELRLLGGSAPASPAARGRLLSALAAQADRLGDRAASEAFFQEAAAAADAVGEPKVQASLRRNVAQGLRRLGRNEEADRLLALAAGTRPQAPFSETPRPAPPETPPVEFARAPEAAPPGPGRPILALHNAYDGGLDKPHIQAVARAAPLAAGFGFDLALVGFPVGDLADLVRRVEAETKVAEGRGFATRLLSEGRILLVPREVHGQPHKWKIADAYVATTQEPDPQKPTDLPALAGRGRLCLILGLGSRGLPEQLLKASPFHLELTGMGVPLETATAMGIAAARLGALRAQ